MKRMKLPAVVLLTCALFLCLAFSAFALTCGDVDGSGAVEAADARLVLRYSVGLDQPDETQAKLADATHDGSIAPDDARLVLRVSVGLEQIVHAFSDRETVVPATCLDNGTDVRRCAFCGEETFITVPAAGHRFPETPALEKAPDCTSDGLLVIRCENCSVIRETELVPALGHTPGEAAEENIIPATCTEDGSKDSVIRCTVCSAELSRKTQVLAKTGHDTVLTEDVPAGCEADGRTVYACTRCDHTETTVIPATGHNYVPGENTPASCTENGAERQKCLNCGGVKETVIPATGHTYEKRGDPEASYWSYGVEKEICAVCGDVKSETYIPALAQPELIDEGSLPVSIDSSVGEWPWIPFEELSGGGTAYISGNRGVDSSVSTIAFTVTGPGVLSFERLASCEKFDGFSVHTDAPAEEPASDRFHEDETWTAASVKITAAEDEAVTVYFCFAKDQSMSKGNDCAAIRKVCFSREEVTVGAVSSASEFGAASVTAGGEEAVTVKAGTTVTLKAEPAEDGQFYVWTDRYGAFVSDSPVCDVTVTKDNEYKALFARKDTFAAMNGAKTYMLLSEALKEAKSGDTVLLLKDHVLDTPCEVKAGVTLVIPCRPADKGYEANGYNPDGDTSSQNAVLESLYRTLTVPCDTELKVSGTLLINAVTGRKCSSGATVQNITGGYAMLLNDGTVTVEEGGIFDCSGKTGGAGKVHALPGAEIRETYSVDRWRGGTYSLNNINNIYPIAESYMNSIRCTLEIESGASLLGTVKIYASGFFNYCRFPQIDNDNGIYRLKKGAVCVRDVVWDEALSTKYSYEVTEGGWRDVYRFYGGMTFSSSTLPLINGIPVSTDHMKWFVVDGDMSFELYDGTYDVEKYFKFLPGFIMKVDKTAALDVHSNAGLLFCDNGYTEADSRFIEPLSTYPGLRKPACLTVCDGSYVHVAAQAELAGKVFLGENAQFSFSKSAISEITTKIPKDYSGACEDYTVILDIE